MRYSTHWITDDDRAAVDAVLHSDWLTCGPKVQEFEEALAQYVGAKYAVAVNSGTAALHLAYRVCDAAWHVTTSPLTFVATANAALLGRGGVSFVDVDPATGNAVFSGKEGGCVVPVHYAGRAATIPAGPVVIEDACHALGAMDFDGCSRVGSCAHSLASCFSFHPVKPITTGEGGAVTTNDQGFAEEVRCLHDHGRKDGLMVSLGGNYRMPDILAALGLSQLKRCDEMRERRKRLATEYMLQLGSKYPMTSGGLLCITTTGSPPLYGVRTLDGAVRIDGYDEPTYDAPCVVSPRGWCGDRNSWHLYPIRIKGGRRDAVKAALNAQGIGAQVHYNPPVHLHPYYRQKYGCKPGDFPEAEAWAAEELSLPLHAGMTEADVERVVDALRGALGQSS